MPQVVQALRALGTEMDRLDDVACRLYGLNRSDMPPLEIVSRGGPIGPTDLARPMGFTTAGITRGRWRPYRRLEVAHAGVFPERGACL
jgi:hypothetical protein